MEHFVKLWSDILDSSVWRQPLHIKVVWVTMLAMAERDGYVGASILGIADRAGVTKEQAKEAIECFLSPDEDSRTKTNDGRRLAEADRGWHILNFEAHRERRDMEQKRIDDRERQRRSRLSRGVTVGHTESPPSQVVAHGEAEAEAEAEAEKRTSTPLPPGFDAFWQAFDKKVSRPHALKAWHSIEPDDALAAKIAAQAKAYAAATPDKAFRKHPATWLNSRGWEDEVVAQGVSGAKAVPVTSSVADSGVRIYTQHPSAMPVPYENAMARCDCGMCSKSRLAKAAQ